jgi:L-iditol 2-dehydrogenase
MQVVAYSGGGRTRLEERPEPVPGPGELLLEMRVCGLCGTDLFKLSADSIAGGTVLGHEVVGTVIGGGAGTAASHGERVVVSHHVPCGDCVFCRRGSETMCETFRENLLEPGGFSERILVRERAVRSALWKVPDGVSDESAVLLEPAACVARGVRRSGLCEDVENGDEGVAVVLGAGPMGLLHVLVLLALLPRVRVFSVDPLLERRRLAEKLGAHGAWEPAAAPEAIREPTGGAGADAVFDTVGGAGVLAQGLALGRRGSSLVLFAHAPREERSIVDLNLVFKEERRVIGTYSGAFAEQQEVHELLSGRRVDFSPLVTHRLPLTRFPEAVERARSLQALKVVLTGSRL